MRLSFRDVALRHAAAIANQQGATLAEYELQSLGLLFDAGSEDYHAQVSSPLPFSLSSILRESDTASNLAPAELARLLANRIESEDDFSVSVGGDGYLNAAATAAFERAFLQDVVSEPREWWRRAIAGSLDSLVDWTKLQQQLCVLPNEELARLQPFLSDPKSAPAARLMLLGMLADDDVDARAFALGMGHSSNIPRFVADVCRECAHFVVTFQPPAQFSGKLLPKLKALAFSIRGCLLEVERSSKPHPFLRALLRLARELAAIVSDPRARVIAPSGPQEVNECAQLVGALAIVLEEMLVQLKSSCEKPDFALQIG